MSYRRFFLLQDRYGEPTGCRSIKQTEAQYCPTQWLKYDWKSAMSLNWLYTNTLQNVNIWCHMALPDTSKRLCFYRNANPGLSPSARDDGYTLNSPQDIPCISIPATCSGPGGVSVFVLSYIVHNPRQGPSINTIDITCSQMYAENCWKSFLWIPNPQSTSAPAASRKCRNSQQAQTSSEKSSQEAQRCRHSNYIICLEFCSSNFFRTSY